MSTHLSVVLHRIPSFTPGPNAASERERDTYRAIIDRTPPVLLAEALIGDHEFDVTRFGVDDVDFHEGFPPCVAAVRDNPQAMAAAREHLYAVVDSHVIGHCAERADILIGGMWAAVYAGRSCGDEPFEGYGGVCALAMLPELSVTPTPGIPASLHGEVCASIGDGMDPAVMKWAAENPGLVDSLVAEELDQRETVVADAVDSVLSEIRADIRDAVVQRIESTLETANARRAFGLPEIRVFHSGREAADARGRSCVVDGATDDRYIPAAVVRRIDRLTARLLRFEGERDGYTRVLHKDPQSGKETVENYGAAEGAYRRQVIAEIERVSDHLAYWQGVRAQQLADGTTMAYDFDVVLKGDQIFHGERWRSVVKVNTKSVSVTSIIEGNLTDRVAYSEIEGLRTAEGNLVRIVEGARVVDPVTETDWSGPAPAEVAS